MRIDPLAIDLALGTKGGVIALLACPYEQESAMSVKTMQDLFIHGLKDIYYAEKKLVQNLPRMAKKAESPELAEAIEQHFAETENQVARLEQVFELCEMTPKGKKCHGIEGLLEEAKEIMSEAEDREVRD